MKTKLENIVAVASVMISTLFALIVMICLMDFTSMRLYPIMLIGFTMWVFVVGVVDLIGRYLIYDMIHNVK